MAYTSHNIQTHQVWKDKCIFEMIGENRYITVLQVVGENIQVIESDLAGRPAEYALPKTLPAPQILRDFTIVKAMSSVEDEVSELS
jgi:hypothetical protein